MLALHPHRFTSILSFSVTLFGVAVSLSCSNPDRCFDASCLGGSGGSGPTTGGAGPTSGGNGGDGGSGGPSVPSVVCGDGIVEGDEICDGENFDGKTCVGLSLPPSKLLCYGDCTLNAAFCGGSCNGIMKDDTEACDGLVTVQCDTLFVGVGATGTPLCEDLCQSYDTSPCLLNGLTCGNSAVEAPELCDGPTITTCVNLGFMGGTLGCHANCTFDTVACHRCGDTTIQPGEQCDLTNLGPTTCENLKYAGGSLSCNPDCTFNTSACLTCGNGTLNPGEDCDSADFGGLTCTDFGFSAGELACDATCGRSTEGCI